MRAAETRAAAAAPASAAERGTAMPAPAAPAASVQGAEPRGMVLVERASAVVTALGEGDAAARVAGFGHEIERVASFVGRQAVELDAARLAAAKLGADNQRLTDENQQMRALLQAILEAVEADRRRTAEAMDGLAAQMRRLGSLVGCNIDERSASGRQAAL
ncbi:hypothetical protein [Arenibaculum pallidiluteum]|uniref:hypothetical protein n=1 Tax=Arenibaculum pallidiluteum TaxID=2812559 RepID=UPI001A968910|nr:hypothetical protein [Arenibaculum pallidiluteum]